MNSAEPIGSDTARVISRIPASSGQGDLFPPISSGLNTSFLKARKKAQTDQRLGWDVFVEAIVSNYLKSAALNENTGITFKFYPNFSIIRLTSSSSFGISFSTVSHTVSISTPK